MEALNKHGIGMFDVVVVNLYPFYDKVTSTGRIGFDDGIENIDIGGPAMIRAAAKFHVLVCSRICKHVLAGGIATAVQHHGKEMSYNNYLDADAAWDCVSKFRNPTCVIVKNTNCECWSE
ncbi:hypothetical protein F3Y22_tig00110221pilonHSYRG00051 [Hibiscus syriacus]|uniref:MGS-like domain-containing protein n=1 Tax=Hibiscus syriacus TaxID=106335 RepID=A0A6A3B6U4_HIBSY|nr:hypothetical protein F3Y22_tig00110221pilonHSYRG00051 [Hibiscus syriacus]